MSANLIFAPNRFARVALCLVASLAIPAPAQADWNAANDEANRQQMMNDMHASSSRNDQINANANNSSTGYSYDRGSSSGRGVAGSTTYVPAPFRSYEYTPPGPRPVVATYQYKIFVRETPAQTVARLHAEASGGNAQSQFNLGRLYYTGYQVPLDRAVARRWFCEAAKQDHPPAKAQCAAMMYVGQGGPVDKALAKQYAKAAAQKNESLGLALDGFYQISEAVDANDFATPRPDVIASLTKAAEQGQLVAQATLGTIVYFYGSFGAPRDMARAVTYLRPCAAQNHPLCMRLLGMLVASGEAGPVDMAQAVALLKGAARAGDPKSPGALAQILSQLDLPMHDDAAAYQFAVQGAANGDPETQVMLARFNYFGQGTPKNIREAARWFKVAADHGNAEAAKALTDPEIASALK